MVQLDSCGACAMRKSAAPPISEIEPLDNDGSGCYANHDGSAAAACPREPPEEGLAQPCTTLQRRGKRTVSRTGLRAAASAAWRKERARAASVRELLGWRQQPPSEPDSASAYTQREEREGDAAANRGAQLPTPSAACMPDQYMEMESIGEAPSCGPAMLPAPTTTTLNLLDPHPIL